MADRVGDGGAPGRGKNGEWRDERHADKVHIAEAERRQERIETVARTSDNLVPVILDAVRKYATIGEISDAMRNVFGLYQETVLL